MRDRQTAGRMKAGEGTEVKAVSTPQRPRRPAGGGRGHRETGSRGEAAAESGRDCAWRL